MLEKLKLSYTKTKQKIATKMFAKELELSYQKGYTKQASLLLERSEKQNNQLKRLTLNKPVIAFHSADKDPIIGFITDVKSNVFFVEDRVSMKTIPIIRKPFDFTVELLHHLLKIDPTFRYYIVTGDATLSKKDDSLFLTYEQILDKLRENNFFTDAQEHKDKLAKSRDKIFGKLFRRNTKVKMI